LVGLLQRHEIRLAIGLSPTTVVAFRDCTAPCVDAPRAYEAYHPNFDLNTRVTSQHVMAQARARRARKFRFGRLDQRFAAHKERGLRGDALCNVHLNFEFSTLGHDVGNDVVAVGKFQSVQIGKLELGRAAVGSFAVRKVRIRNRSMSVILPHQGQTKQSYKKKLAPASCHASLRLPSLLSGAWSRSEVDWSDSTGAGSGWWRGDRCRSCC
jgi:hypothetical protein